MKYMTSVLFHIANLLFTLHAAPTSSTSRTDHSITSSFSTTSSPLSTTEPMKNAGDNSLVTTSTIPSSTVSSSGNTQSSQGTLSISRRSVTSTPSPLLELLTIYEQCSENKTAVIAHPSHCALYYNCSHVYDFVPDFMEQHMLECPYPKLFSEETGQCEDYRQVKCKERAEPKWECQYRKNWCSEQVCYQSCESRFPSCLGLEDGKNPYHPQAWLPYYKVCKDERTTKVSLCQRGLKPIVFNPYSLACEEDRIAPKEYNIHGVCSRKFDGFYADSFGRCHRYYECRDYKFRAWLRCTSGHVFDETTQTCQRPEAVCGSCGTKREQCDDMKPE